MIHFRSEAETYEEADGAEELTDLEIKEKVRERDGRKCRDCGTTSEEHIEQHGRDLDVHRLIPGSPYGEGWCVALCRACHGKKPKNALDALFCADLRWVCFNLYNGRDAQLYAALKRRCGAEGLSDFLAQLLERCLQEVIEHDRADLLMQADGLW
jgi:hypothetical protein